ncbi:MAG: recombination associated protein RdgC [Methylococcaceae bacterium NSP1-2]|nr:recombination-associated protein RdgC [Methylococcaceae bacterium]OYV15505.1 MAG: recombination associated protein RdgC [Methylococcaceae bacterium NSP1-2]
MWFKNLSIFRLTEAFTLTAEELEEKLETLAFRPCGSHEDFSLGWVSPIGKAAPLVHSANGFMMICTKKEERVLPASVLNEMMQEKIDETEEAEGRKLSKKERTAIKDELIFELLPRAFTFSRKLFAYIDVKGGFLVVNSGSTKSAEDLLSLLRKCLGSLPAVPLNTVEKPIATMTEWLLTQKTPKDVKIEDECELRAPEEAGGVIRCKRHDLSLPEIKNHLDIGKQVIKLALTWDDRLSFILDENLSVKRLKFLDLIQDQVTETDAHDEAARFDVDFSIMSLELANFIPRLLEIFGGELKA